MSFLDNLENSLKSLEGREENAADNRQRRNADRTAALAAAPWAEKLKTGTYTQELLKQATRAGYSMRTKVYIAWLGTTLRLEAREKKLELRPAPNGIQAVFLQENQETQTELLDLTGKPEDLVKQWLG